MPLTPFNAQHQQQIAAGTKGRLRGHHFENQLASEINTLSFPAIFPSRNSAHLFCGNPALQLIQYIANDRNQPVLSAKAWWLGGLATSGLGDTLYDDNGNAITQCKSDIVIELKHTNGFSKIGVSVKTCNKRTPTNDQMYFTTAKAFCQLLRSIHITVSRNAEYALEQFCGDIGFRPLDLMPPEQLSHRLSDPARYYWEELPSQAQEEWKYIFTRYQDDISLLLFQKAYRDDPYPPDYLLHQRTRYENFNLCPTAIFSIPEIVLLSREYSGFTLAPYVIRKGRYKSDPSTHLAPRFGFIQFQRGGQKQHPTQLQFNLKAGYFHKLPQKSV